MVKRSNNLKTLTLPSPKGRGEKRLAIFDIDGTIFRSSLLIELSHALVNAKIFPSSARKEISKEYLAWLDRKGSYEAYIDKVIKIYVKHIAGKSFAQVDKVARQVIGYQKDRVYRFTRDFIKQLKTKNYFLVAISGSPSYIVEKYAKAIGFNLFFGTELEVKKGKFTGKVKSLDSAFNKAKIVKDLAHKYRADLKNSVAVGDTEGDIAMLKLVGRPLAFNPDLGLAKFAKQHGWKVVAERKDVIYQIKKFDFLNNFNGKFISIT
jgi:HAD superfamily hydrolase (TIGR01490 family)